MTRQEFSKALELARTNELQNTDDTILHGCGTKDFQKVTTTLKVVAKFIRWHALQLNGEPNPEALNELMNIFRYKVEIV